MTSEPDASPAGGAPEGSEEPPRGLDALFRPRSVAVIGTSRKAKTIGREILANLVDMEFRGPVHPVNPAHDSVRSMRCFPSVLAIPGGVDLAIVVVPAARVLGVVKECAQAGVRGLVIITAGFRETGPAGRRLEDEVMAVARSSGMRVIGPNCMGIVNTDPAIRLNASFATGRPPAGSVAFLSQSGALGEAILLQAQDLNLGMSFFVSVGNRADVSTNELLEYWEDDPRVGPILLYLESAGSPHRFPEIARRVSRRKPIIAVKAGRTAAGASAARSHTGALAGVDVAIDTLLDQVGVLRVATIEDMFATAAAFATQPLPAGPRIGIVTNSGGPGILATDECVSLGLEMANLSEATQAALRAALPPEAAVGNPVDTIASAQPEQVRAAVATVAADPSVDALLVIFVTPVYLDSLAVARALVDATRGLAKPVLSCFMGKEHHREAVDELRRAGIPVYSFPEAPVRALAEMARRTAWLARDPGGVPALAGIDLPAGEAVVARAREAGRRALTFDEARRLVEAHGFPFAPSHLATSLDEVVDAARAVGFPLVLKAQAPGLSHKTDVGGVAADLRTIDELVAAHHRMRQSLAGQAGLQFIVQAMARGDREVILGMRRDPDFGPLLMFGLGGIHVEVLKDVAFRVHPITDADARDMIRSLRGHALLAGVRGAPPVPEDFMIELLLRLDRLVADHPSIQEIDLNPVMLGGARDECVVVDARVSLGDAPSPQGEAR